jgi:hypothetical protein
MISVSAALLSTLLLVQCGKSAQPVDISIIGARNGIFLTETLVTAGLAVSQAGVTTPSALLGPYVALFLGGNPDISKTATQGATDAQSLLTEDQQHPDESFALLQELGTVLQVDINDMLNRSPDRQVALDAYVSTLQNVLNRSKTEVTALKQQQNDLIAQQRDKQHTVANLQHELNIALQKQDYTTASDKQELIVPAQADLAAVTSQVNQLNSTLVIFNNLNNIAAQRLTAMQQNREVLIAGLHVVNVPGISDLGLLQKQAMGGSTNSVSIFGGTGN